MAYRGTNAQAPERKHLRHWERVCGYLDSQPYRAVRHPFPSEPPMSVRLFKRMAKFKLVRHFEKDCTYRLAVNWQTILRRLWDGTEAETAPAALPEPGKPFIADANADTMYVSILVPPRDDEDDAPPVLLPEKLTKLCIALKEQAQDEDTSVETPWRIFDAPLNMWKAGVGTGAKKRGISWSFLLRNDYVMLRLRKAPMNRLIGSVRLSAKLLWSYGPRQALDAVYALLHQMWGDEVAFADLTWQLAELHLCADVANFSPRPEVLDRLLTFSCKKAVHVPSVADEETPLPSSGDLDEYLNEVPDDWNDLPDVFFADDYLEAFADDADDEESSDDDDEDEDESPSLEEQGAAVYLYGQRASGFAFSAGAPMSAAWYDKELEERLSGKIWMRDYHEAGGWRPGMALYRIEGRMKREVLREMGHALGEAGDWTADPFKAIDHFNDFWGYMVGLPPEHDHAPDVTHRGWMRLAQRVEGDSNKSRWPTDSAWLVIQRASFAQALPVVPLSRKQVTVHDPRAIDAEIYGLLKLRSVIHRRQMDQTLSLSMELRAFVQDIEDWIEQTGREDYWREVREKARGLGQPVPILPAGVLPFGIRKHRSE